MKCQISFEFDPENRPSDDFLKITFRHAAISITDQTISLQFDCDAPPPDAPLDPIYPATVAEINFAINYAEQFPHHSIIYRL